MESNPSRKLTKSQRKLAKKQAKACHTLFKHDGIHTASNPTCNLLVANGGLGNGIKRYEIQQLFSCVGPLENIVMLREKPYCFVQYGKTSQAVAAMRRLHGYLLKDGKGPTSVTLYLSFVENVPDDTDTKTSLPPPGLDLIPDFIDEQTEQRLISSIDWGTDLETEKQSLKHRRVKHHGYEFKYSTNNVDKDQPLPDGMPALYSQIIDRIMETGHVRCRPDQLTINQYQPGQGIPSHIDTHSAFEDAIVSLSLGSQVVMEFNHPEGGHVPMVLPSRSLLIMTGEARYLWTHGITPRKSDVIPDPTSLDDLTLHQRGQRTSFTFRAVRMGQCGCNYPSQCDSQRTKQEAAQNPQIAFPRSEDEAAQLEADQVHMVYDEIAGHFSGTRYKPWPRVVDFLNQLVPGSLVLDVGCGNGKYLDVNKQLYMIGCDRSSQLISICRNRGLEGFVCDSLHIPMGTASMDACICIAVIHHMSTRARRLHALRELSRVLRPGGKALVTVWAMEQERKKEKSKYISRKKSGTAGDILTPKAALKQESEALDESPRSEAFGISHPVEEHTARENTGPSCTDCGAGESRTKASSGDAECGTGNFKMSRGPEYNKKTDSSEQNSPCPTTTDTWQNSHCANKRNGSSEVSNTTEISPTSGVGSEMAKSGLADNGEDDCIEINQCLDNLSESTKALENEIGIESEETGEARDMISVHKNRTQFEQQDLLVPWHLNHKPTSACSDTGGKELEMDGKRKVFFRYYHVFVEGEIEELCRKIDGVSIVGSYYDQGNWCVIFQKQ